MASSRPTNVKFDRGGSIIGIPKYYGNSEITERDLLFLNGDLSSNVRFPIAPADTLIMAEPKWVEDLKIAISSGNDLVDFFTTEGPAPIVATSRLSLINPDFELNSKETKLVVAKGEPKNVKYDTGNNLIDVAQYENSLDVFNILFSAAGSTYGAATDYNIPTGQAVKDMITTGIDGFVGIMEYKGAITHTGARHNTQGTIQKGWVYIASTDIYGYAMVVEQEITYTYSNIPLTTGGSLVFRCEQGDMVVVNQDIGANVPLLNYTIVDVGIAPNCDVFERNLTGAVTATNSFGWQNRVILSDSSSRTIKSIENGANGTILTIVGGVPSWQKPSAAATVHITQDETTNQYKYIIFSGIGGNGRIGGNGLINTEDESVYYSSKAGFNPSTGTFSTVDISVHRDSDATEEAAWVSQSIFWNFLEEERQP